MKKLSKIWMITSLGIIILLSILTESTMLQIVAAICGVIYVFNNIFENKYGQLFGIVNSLLYGVIMYSNGIYGTSIYNFIYCIPMQIYTFFTWGKDKDGKAKLNVTRFTNSQRSLGVLLVAIGAAIYAIVASRLNVNFALADGLGIILGIVGLYLASKKKIEQWYAFIFSNIAMIVLWTIKCIENFANIPMLLMWCIYIINNIYGLYTWNKKIKEIAKENKVKSATN